MAGCTDDEDPGEETETPDDTETATPGESTEEPTEEPVDEVPPVQGSYITAGGSEARSLNPYRLNDTTSSARVGLVLDGAYTLDDNDEIAGRWIESVETDDYQTYRATLRDNLQWSSEYGQMTASDWVFHINNVVTHEDNWAGHVSRADWVPGDEPVEAEEIDDLTFEFTLPEPDVAFPKKPALWGEFILPKDLVEPYFEDYQDGNEEAGDELDELDEIRTLQYTGNLGPYTFERREVEDRFVAVRNEDYYMREVGDEWEEAPYFEDYTIRVLEEESTRLNELQAGGVTHAAIPSRRADEFKEMEDVQIVQTPTPYCSIIAYNQRANGWEPLRQREVRQAFAMALDKSVIVENIYYGYADVAHTFQPEYSEFYDDSQVLQLGEGDTYDPAAARQQLEDALPSEYGYEGDTLVGPDGQVELTLVFSNASEQVEDAGRLMGQEYEQNLGISLELEAVPFNTMLDRYAMQVDDEGEPLGFNAGDRDEFTSELSWDLMWGIGFNTYPRTPESVATFWTADGPTNYYGYEPEADIGGMLSDSAKAEDPQERQSILAEVFGILSEDQPTNFVQFATDIDGYDANLQFTEEPSQSWGYKAQTWYFDEV